MIVIANKTETHLRDDLQKLLKHKPSQRCFYIAFSKTDISKEHLFETFLRSLEEIPNAYMAKVYLCADKDIMIMMEGFMQRHFEDLIKKLDGILKIKDFSDLIDIYELGAHWNILKNLYEQKLQIIQNVEDDQIQLSKKIVTDKLTLETLLKIDPERASNQLAHRDNRKNPLVMIADDDQLTRTLAGNVLRADFDMVFAQNGREALTEFANNAPDILFLDIGMPDIGGHEVLETLFQIDPDAHIIMFSGRKDKTTIMKSLEMGAKGFLGKPFTRDELYNHVQNSPFVLKKEHQAA